MDCILALDQGTTSCRALLIDKEGSILRMAQREFPQYFPKPGWVEHNAEEIWKAQWNVIQEVLPYAKKIAGIGITNQRETTVVWKKSTGKPLCNAIVWQDRRTATYCDALEAHEEMFRKKTGLILDPYFSAPKLQWILKEHPDEDVNDLAFGTMDTWLIWNLTKGKLHVTDRTNASRTLLFNIHTGKWDEEILKLLGIPNSLLPEVKRSSEIFGETEILPDRIPIAGVAGDQQAALFGQSCHSPGQMKVTYGTGCFLLMHTGSNAVRSKNKLLTTIAASEGDTIEYALEGSVFMGGALVQWLRDQLHLISSSSEIEQLALGVDESHDVVFIPAFTGLGAPYWDPYAKGALLGLTRGSNAQHIARAALEGIAQEVLDVLELMQEEAHSPIKEMRVDGGAAENNFLMQFQANISGISIARPTWKEVTALGAGFLAGLAVGFWKDKNAIVKLWKLEKEFTPNLAPEKIKTMRKKWKKAIKLVREYSNESQ